MAAVTTREDGMPTQAMSTIESKAATPQLFKHVLVGVDQSFASAEAARQAALLTDPGRMLTLLAAWTMPPPIGVIRRDLPPKADEDVYRKSAAGALALAVIAVRSLATATARLVRGLVWDELIKEAASTDGTLIVVGSHGHGRIRGIIAGSTATEVIHKAPCSVLVARPAGDGFPRRIVVGVDGSPESAAAYAVARRIADRFASELWPVAAQGGESLDRNEVAKVADHHRIDLPGEPVQALLAACADADLLIVGSRGLHGLKAWGSVSERVAHQASCSTLIVRDPRPSREDSDYSGDG
jgi:nucleotide-binding universal stress UspA family protein